MKTKLMTLILSIAFTFCIVRLFADASITTGKTIFTTQCTSCHSINARIVGPALANVDQRHSFNWILNFIHSPKTLIEKNDTSAVALYNEFDQIIMPDHADLSSDDVKNILAYIKSETQATPATEAPFVKPGKLVPNYHPLSIQQNYGFFISYLLAVLILVLLLLFAVNIKGIQRNRTNK